MYASKEVGEPSKDSWKIHIVRKLPRISVILFSIIPFFPEIYQSSLVSGPHSE